MKEVVEAIRGAQRITTIGHENPDADTPTGPTKEQLEQLERRMGAATRTVEGWRGPGAGTKAIEDPRSLIAYIEDDPTLSTVMVFDEPRVTTAQPEVRPDLPDPRWAAGGGPGEGGGGGCTKGYCD